LLCEPRPHGHAGKGNNDTPAPNRKLCLLSQIPSRFYAKNTNAALTAAFAFSVLPEAGGNFILHGKADSRSPLQDVHSPGTPGAPHFNRLRLGLVEDGLFRGKSPGKATINLQRYRCTWTLAARARIGSGLGFLPACQSPTGGTGQAAAGRHRARPMTLSGNTSHRRKYCGPVARKVLEKWQHGRKKRSCALRFPGFQPLASPL